MTHLYNKWNEKNIFLDDDDNDDYKRDFEQCVKSESILWLIDEWVIIFIDLLNCILCTSIIAWEEKKTVHLTVKLIKLEYEKGHNIRTRRKKIETSDNSSCKTVKKIMYE